MKKILLILISMTMIAAATGCSSDSASGDGGAATAAVENVDDSELAASIQEILDSEYYPDIVSIEVSPDYKEFTITLEADEMNIYESMLLMSFYTTGNEHQIANGVAEEDAVTVVRYVNGSTNEVISESDSTSMKTE